MNLKCAQKLSFTLCFLFYIRVMTPCFPVFSFHIQLYNADSLLACALPYHDTNVFVRVLQLLKISDATSRWNWLRGLQVGDSPELERL